MDRFRLDQLAILLAATRSRRQVFRVVTAGFVSTVVLARSARPAAAELCEERVPRPGYTPTFNGCGPSGYGWTVPDNYGDANFTPACNHHDRCYGTCNESRLTCDILFRKYVRQACKRAYGGKDERKKLRKCLGRARFYANVVADGGQDAYEAAQNEACECCGPGGDSCGTRCCVEGSVCTDPGTQKCCAHERACGDKCCASGEVCCNGECYLNCVPGFVRKPPTCACGCSDGRDVCRNLCCPPDQICIGGDTCCLPDRACGEQCCSEGDVCCNDSYCSTSCGG